jgi:ribonuclease HII
MHIRPGKIPPYPNTDHEQVLWAHGYSLIAGVDEVGRGPLAGPVVAAAVILDPTDSDRWLGVFKDSKKMTEAQRESAFVALTETEIPNAVGACSSEEIDSLGIYAATKLAMARAIEGLDPQPDLLLVDAMNLDAIALPQRSLIKGDAVSLSIAAASVVAKVTRDRLMADVFNSQFPEYGFAAHKGYGTASHLEALRQNGPCEIHRTSFRPVREALSLR